MAPASNNRRMWKPLSHKPLSVFLLGVILIGLVATILASPALAGQAFATPGGVIPPAGQLTGPERLPGKEETRFYVPGIDGLSALRFEHLTIDDGLSETSVYSIQQDKQGFLWFATEEGLNRYNGYEFTVYRNSPINPYSLSDNNILSLLVDPSGTLWVGTLGGGFNRFEPEKDRFIHYRHDPENANSLADNTVLTIYMDRQGYLWLGTANGLDRFDPRAEKFVHFNHVSEDGDSLSHTTINAITQDREGFLWVGTASGLDRLDPRTGRLTRYTHTLEDSHTLAANSVSALYEDRSGRLWVGTSSGLDRFDPGTGKFIHYRPEPASSGGYRNSTITSISEDAGGTVWIGTLGGGLSRLDPSTGQFVTFQNDPGDPYSLNSNEIHAVYFDRQGILWIGTFGGGINKLPISASRFSLYRSISQNPNSLSGNNIYAIAQDCGGDLWIGSKTGLDRLNRQTGTFTHYRAIPTDPGSLSEDSITAIYASQSGPVWVGTRSRGLNLIDPQTGKITHYRFNPNNRNSLSSDQIRVILEDSSGEIWVGTYNAGVNRLDPDTGKITRYRREAGKPYSLAHNRVWAILEDRSGGIWIGNGNGLDHYDGEAEQFDHYRYKGPAAGEIDIIAIYEDQEGIFWLGTYGDGLLRFDRSRGTFSQYRIQHGLPAEVIYAILEDKNGYLWLSTNRGLSRFDPGTDTFKNFDVRDGLQSNEFNFGAYFRSPDGEFFFGGINGLTVFRPESMQDNPHVPPVVLTSLTRGGETITTQRTAETLQQVTLRWPANYFEFEFAALDYTRPEKNQYAYKLEGFDKDWNYIGERRNGRYTNLPGRTYRLLLKGSNNDGLWNEAGTAIYITVIPPFWETWWFRGGLALVLMLSVLGGYRLRVHSMQVRTQELERLVRERTEQYRRRNQEIEALYHADERMHRYLAVEQVLQALVDVAVELLAAGKSAVFTWDENRERLWMRVANGFSTEAMAQLSFACEEGIIGDVAANGQPVHIGDTAEYLRWPRERPEIMQAYVAEGIRSLLCIPLSLDQRVFGVFTVCSAEPGAFDEDTLRLFLALAQRASLSIENAQLFEQTRELAVIEERGRLARDLHDSAKQKAFAALAQLGTARTVAESNPAAAKRHLGEAENLVYDVLQEMIFLIQEMYPVALKERGLATALREYIFEWENRSDIPVDLNIAGGQRLPLQIEQALYRIVQEALANIARHSQASKVEISLIYRPKAIDLLIADNGQGFDLLRKQNGMGLCSMQERVAMVNGELTIDSAPGKGTRIAIKTPTKIKG